MAWLTALWSGMSAVHPWLLWGGLAVASPIIIHLLSKRKFRILDWAAMDFLLEAERKNRRRVQLENILLLLLRCLIMALIAALAARPFFQPQSAAQSAGEGAGFERVFLLDDSASMQALGDNKQVVFDTAKSSLAAFIEELAESRPSDRVTVLTTSNPETPLFNARFLRASGSDSAGGTSSAADEGAAEISRTIKALEPTDRTADLPKALLAVEKLLRADSGQINRVVYVIGDFRRRDWALKAPAAGETSATPPLAATNPSGATPKDDAPVQVIKKNVAPHALAVQLCDVGSNLDDNLIVSGIQVLDDADQPNAWVAGVKAKVSVAITNAGRETAAKVDVELAAGDAGTQRKEIADIKPGETESVFFDVTVMPENEAEPKAANLLVRASIDRADVLRADNERILAGRVSPGVKVLIVDGDQGEDIRDSERRFLNMALAPAGYRTRYKVDWCSDAQFEDGVQLDQYDCIFLCNVYRVPEEQIVSLDKWVRAGGGLVFALGNRVDEQYYNEKLFNEGKGLMPLRLAGQQGDEKGETWASMAVETKSHPMWKFMQEAAGARPEVVKVFRWWRGELPKEAIDAKTMIVAKITDPEVAGGAPSVVDRAVGLGRVVAMAIPLDADWTDWPDSLTYAMAMSDLGGAISRRPRDDADLVVGQPIELRLDAQRFRRDVKVGFIPTGSRDDAAKRPADANAAGAKGPDAKGPVAKEIKTEQATPDPTGRFLDLKYVETGATGYYEVETTKLDGEAIKTLYATNVDPTEGQLARVDHATLQSQLGESATLVSGGPSLGNGADGAKKEFSTNVLFALLGVLGVEQLLAWWFGKKRS